MTAESKLQPFPFFQRNAFGFPEQLPSAARGWGGGRAVGIESIYHLICVLDKKQKCVFSISVSITLLLTCHS